MNLSIMDMITTDIVIVGEGGAAGVAKGNDSFENHFNDTVTGGDWLSDQDAVDLFVKQAPKELTQLEQQF